MYHTSNKIYDQDAVLARVHQWRIRDQKIVFVNGCFDVLNAAEIEFLETAARLGDRLIVSLNDTPSTSEILGAGNPVLSDEARCKMVAALEFVDAVTLDSGTKPVALVERIHPEHLVKGFDPRTDLESGGKEVHSIDFNKENSGRQLVDRIKTT